MEEDTLSQSSQLTNSLISPVDEEEKNKVFELVHVLQHQEQKMKFLRAELTKRKDSLKKWKEGIKEIEWREEHCDKRIKFVKKSIDETDKSNKEMADKLLKRKEHMEQTQKDAAALLKEKQDFKQMLLTRPDPLVMQRIECENKLKMITESLNSALLKLQMRRGTVENDETAINLENKIKTYFSGIKKQQQEREEKQNDLEEAEAEEEEGEGQPPFLNVLNLVGHTFDSDEENRELQNKLDNFKQVSEMMRMESVEAFIPISRKILANQNIMPHCMRESTISGEKNLADATMEANDRNRSSGLLAPQSHTDSLGNNDISKHFENPVDQCAKPTNATLGAFQNRFLQNNPLLFSKGIKFSGSSSETFRQNPHLGKNEPQPPSTAVKKSRKLEDLHESKMKKLKEGFDGKKENLTETFTFSADDFLSKRLSSDYIKETGEKKHQRNSAKDIDVTDETMDVTPLCMTMDGKREFTSKDTASDFDQPANMFHDVQAHGPVSALLKTGKSSKYSSPCGSYQLRMDVFANFSTPGDHSLKANDSQGHSTSKHLTFVSDNYLTPHMAKDFVDSATLQHASNVPEAHTPFDFDKFLKPLSPSPKSPSLYQMTSRNMFNNKSDRPKMARSLQSIVDNMNKLRLPASSSSDKKHSEKTDATLASLKPKCMIEDHGSLSSFSKKN